MTSSDGDPSVALAAAPAGASGKTDIRGTRWCPAVQLNYAEHLLRGSGLAADDAVVIAESQIREPVTMTLAIRTQISARRIRR